MQLINELAYIIELDRPKSFNEVLAPGSKVYLLYNLITRRNKTEEEAAQIIYKSTAKDKKYLMLKGSLIKKLTDLVMVSDPGLEENSYLSTELLCERRLLIAKKLLQLNVYHNAERILKKVEREALDLHLTSVLVKAYTLFRQIAALKPDPQAAIIFQEKIDRYLKENSLEQKATGQHEILLSQVKGIRSVNKDFSKYAWEAEYELRQADLSNAFIKAMELRIKAIRLAIEQQWFDLRKTIAETEQHFLDHPHIATNQTFLEMLLYKLRLASICMNFEKCERILQQAYQKAEYQAFDIFDFKSEEFDFCLRSGNYHRAGAVLQEVLASDQFGLLNPVDHAQWRVKEAYLYFLSKNDSSLTEFVITFNKSYTLQDFMLETAPLTKDKQGFNLQFLIAKVLLHEIAGEDHSDEINSLKTYYQRHLKDCELLRTQIFFRNLIKLLRQNDLSRRVEILHQFYDELTNTDSYDYCELLPYERTLELIAQCYHKDVLRTVVG